MLAQTFCGADNSLRTHGGGPGGGHLAVDCGDGRGDDGVYQVIVERGSLHGGVPVGGFTLVAVAGDEAAVCDGRHSNRREVERRQIFAFIHLHSLNFSLSLGRGSVHILQALHTRRTRVIKLFPKATQNITGRERGSSVFS